MPVEKLHAYLAASAATGEVAEIRGKPIRSEWIASLMAGELMPRVWHSEVSREYPLYERFVPEAEYAPVPVRDGVRVANATIVGKLDLSSLASERPLMLSLVECRLEGAGAMGADGFMTSLDLRGARLRGLSLRGSQASHVDAAGVVVEGDVDLSGLAPLGDWKSQPWPGATKRQLKDEAEQFAKRAMATADRETDSPSNVSLYKPPDPADRETEFPRNVSLSTTRTARAEDKSDATVQRWPSGYDQHCWCDFANSRIAGAFVAKRVRLRIARRKPEELDKRRGERRRCCLDLSRSHVGGSLDIGERSILEGSLEIDSSRIAGDVKLESVQLRNGERESALAAHGAKVEGSVYIFEAEDCPRILGRIWLQAARIAGSLDLSGALLDGGGDDTVIAESLRLGESMYMRADFASNGCLWLKGCRIENDLCLTNATVVFSEGRGVKQNPYLFALVAYGLRAEGQILLEDNVIAGMVDLRGASCGTAQDYLSGYRGAWPVLMDGFCYARVEYLGVYGKGHDARPTTMADFCEHRKKLMKRQTPFRPQPYTQLAHVLHATGNDDEARRVLVERSDRERRSAEIRGLSRLVRTLFGWMFGYGLNPSRATATLLIALGVGWGLFSLVESRGFLAVAQQPVAQELREGVGMGVVNKRADPDEKFTTEVRCGDLIRTWLYAIDVFVPLLDLREEDKCEVRLVKDERDSIGGGDGERASDRLPPEIEENIYRFLKALYAFVGAVLTSLALLTFSGIVRTRMLRQD